MHRGAKETRPRLTHGHFKPRRALRFARTFRPRPPQDLAVDQKCALCVFLIGERRRTDAQKKENASEGAPDAFSPCGRAPGFPSSKNITSHILPISLFHVQVTENALEITLRGC